MGQIFHGVNECLPTEANQPVLALISWAPGFNFNILYICEWQTLKIDACLKQGVVIDLSRWEEAKQCCRAHCSYLVGQAQADTGLGISWSVLACWGLGGSPGEFIKAIGCEWHWECHDTKHPPSKAELIAAESRCFLYIHSPSPRACDNLNTSSVE